MTTPTVAPHAEAIEMFDGDTPTYASGVVHANNNVLMMSAPPTVESIANMVEFFGSEHTRGFLDGMAKVEFVSDSHYAAYDAAVAAAAAPADPLAAIADRVATVNTLDTTPEPEFAARLLDVIDHADAYDQALVFTAPDIAWLIPNVRPHDTMRLPTRLIGVRANDVDDDITDVHAASVFDAATIVTVLAAVAHGEAWMR